MAKGSWNRVTAQRGGKARFDAAWAESFPWHVTKLGNGAWRFASDPEDEWRETAAPTSTEEAKKLYQKEQRDDAS
jgi:hypothetical protein